MPAYLVDGRFNGAGAFLEEVEAWLEQHMRVLAGRGDVSGGGFGRSSPAPEESQGARGSYLRDNGPSTTVQIVAALDSTPNRACAALGKANVECEGGRYRLADDE
jgi:hypothetical protein